MNKFFIFLLFLFSLFYAQPYCAVYFNGVGCPHCASVEGQVLSFVKNNDVILINYEIYQHRDNTNIFNEYNSKYNVPLGVPLLLINYSNYLIGSNNVKHISTTRLSTYCPLLQGYTNNLTNTTIEGTPYIFYHNRVAFPINSTHNDSALIFLFSSNLTDLLLKYNVKSIKPVDVVLPGITLHYENAIVFGNWIIEWNGAPFVKGTGTIQFSSQLTSKPNLSIWKIISLAFVDSINPCALAVLTLALLTILSYDPTKRYKVITVGGAFVLAIVLFYLLYGILLIRFFQIVQMLTYVHNTIYKAVALFAIVLGYLHVKDFVDYKEGGFLTEMPVSLRPYARKLISSITSEIGGFTIGAFISLFLLPCTIGPYIVVNGMFSYYSISHIIPYLVLYNLIFILPMLFIILAVYMGLKRVKDIQHWRDINIRYIHLISGLIMLLLGILMFFGFI